MADPSTSKSEPPKSAAPPAKAKKKKSPADLQRELQDLQKSQAKPRAPVEWNKIYLRLGGVVVALWVVAFIVPSWIAKAIVGAVTLVVLGGLWWFKRYVAKSENLQALLQGADTVEGRKEALKRLEEDFGKDDTQAIMARAQLEMQEDPRKALATLETIDVEKLKIPGMSDQVRALRANLHLMLHEAAAARALVDKIELGKQQDTKVRAQLATIAGEAWARTGNAKKAVETLELFNPEDPELSEAKIQMYRARAFAYAYANDTKSMQRTLKKLAEASPQLLAMFLGSKKVHPLLQKEAQQLLMKSGAVPRKMVRQRM